MLCCALLASFLAQPLLVAGSTANRLAGFGALAPLGAAYQIGVLLAAGLMVWQHRLLGPDDLSRIQTAFFTANGTIAIGMLALGCIDIYLLRVSR